MNVVSFAWLIEQSGLRPVCWRCEAQMGPAPTVQASASCRPSDEAKLNQVRLDDFLNGVTGFGQAGGQRFHAHRPAPIGVGDQIGRAQCRERVCQYEWSSVVAVAS